MNPNLSQQDGQIRIRPSIFTPHPAGIADVKITNIELAESTVEGWAPRLCFDLESALADEQGQPRLLRSYVSTTFSPGSKLEAVVLATLGKSASDFGPQEELVVEEMVGKTCRVVVKHDTKDGKTRALVTEWVPTTNPADDDVRF
ncbi:MAG: hypothetical protein QF569_28430 [Candidatus Poribacteria bacterium]|nr:hypothetical protein [Candidatus Poribacteria bacterium]